MAGLGIGPEEFAVFDLEDPEARAGALEELVQPRLLALGRQIVAGLSRVAGKELYPHLPRIARRKGVPPEEALVAFSESPKGTRGLPYLAISVTRAQLHARIAVHGEGPRNAAMRRVIEREAANLARKGKPFRKLRSYLHWNFEDLPELAPAHSAVFWEEVAQEITGAARGRVTGMDVGVAWSLEEARSLAVGDVLGAFRDLAPLYKLLANAE